MNAAGVLQLLEDYHRLYFARERAELVIDAARVLVQHWEDQDGFGSDVVEALVLAVRVYDERVRFGPHGTPCTFCGTYGDESTQDPLSGDEQGCFECCHQDYLRWKAET